MAKPWLFIGSGYFIYGNREGLEALQRAIDDAIAGDVAPDGFARAMRMHHADNCRTNYCVQRVDDLARLERIIEQD